ncbi:hypothetical protein CBL_04726 [Carabus blaptoides fortunei]
MFSKTTFVFALLALFAVQSSSALQLQTVDERSIADLFEKAKEAIRKFGEIVSSAVGNAVDKLGAIKDKIFANAKEIISDARDTILNIVDKVKNHIEHIKEQAENLGLDVKECIEENKTQLQQLPKNIIDKLLQCVSEQMAEAKNIIEEAITEIMSIKDKLTGLPQKLKECVASGKPVSCISKLIAQIVSDITQIPSNIQESVNKIMDLVANLQANLMECALSKIKEVSMEAAAIGANVAKCVAGKIEA